MDFLQQLGVTPALLLTQIVGFIILMLLLQRFAFGPLFGILDDRKKIIQDTYDQLDRDKANMQELRHQYEQRLAGIEAKAREEIQAAVKEGQALRESLVADAEQQVESILAHGRNEAERERQKAFLEMRQQVVTLAVAAAGKVVGEALNDSRHTKLVDDFITEVGAGRVEGVTVGQSQSQNGTQKGITAA